MLTPRRGQTAEPSPSGAMKPIIDDCAAGLLSAFERAGVLAFLVEQLGHRVELGIADEARSRARSVITGALPDWVVSTSREGLLLDPPWGGSGGSGIDLSFWQGNDLGERERVGRRGLDRILAPAEYVSVPLGGHTVAARPSYVPESDRHRPRFPIDAVISWVDNSDEQWLARFDEARGQSAVLPQSVDPARFRSRDELKYVLRSIERFAPFVRHIYVVTDCRAPSWLKTTDPALHIVNQTELLGGSPVFNSLAVEAAIHRIDGLTEHYLYFNDDMFVARPIEPELFFSPTGSMQLTDGPRIRAGAARPDENAFETSAKQARDLIRDAFGWTPERSANHVPLPQRRSVAQEIEAQFSRAVSDTRSSTFRALENTTTATGLCHYLGEQMGITAQSAMRWSYVDAADRFAPSQYADLLASCDVDVFCCNDGASASPEKSGADLVSFLEQYFPGPGRFELP